MASPFDKGGDFVSGKGKKKKHKGGSGLLDKGASAVHGKKHSKKKRKKNAEAQKAASAALRGVQRAQKGAVKAAVAPYKGSPLQDFLDSEAGKFLLGTDSEIITGVDAKEKKKLERLGLPTSLAAGDAPMIGPIGQSGKVASAIKGLFSRSNTEDALKAAAKASDDTAKATTKKAATMEGAKPPKAKAPSPKAEAKRIKKTTSDVGGSSKIGKSRRVKQDTKRTIAAEKEVYGTSKTAKEIKAAKRVARTKGAAAIGGTAAPMAPVVYNVAKNTAQATYEDPGKTFSTTAKSLPALVTAPVGTAKAIAQGNLDQVVQEYKDYADLMGIVAGDNSEEAVKAIQNDAGLVPAATLALSAYGIGKLGAGGRALDVTSPSPPGRRTRLLQEKALSEADAQKKLTGKKTPLRNREGRVTVAKEQARFEHAGQALGEGDLKKGGLSRHARSAQAKKIATVQTGTKRDGTPILKTVKVADAIPTLGRFPVALERVRGEAQVRDLVARMEKSRRSEDATNPAVLSDLDVLRAIRDNPSVLENKSLRKALEARQSSAPDVSRTRAVLSGEDGKTPLVKDERARLVPMARMLDENTPEEMVPKALEGVTKVTPQKYQKAAAAIRKEASDEMRKFNRLVAKGKKAEAEPHKAKAMLLRGEVNRLRRADAMDKLATRLQEGGKVPKKYRDLDPTELREAAQVLRQEAKTLRDEHLNADSELNREFVDTMQSRLGEEGYRDPFYVKTGDAREYPSTPGNEGMPHADLTPADKMTTGSLAERGLNTAGSEAFLKGIVEQRINQAQTMFGRSLLENKRLTQHDAEGKPLIYTSDEFARALNEGDIPPGYDKISVQEMNKLFQMGRWEEARGAMDSPFHQALRESRGKEGRKYFAVQKGALKEFKAQGKELGAGWKALRIIGAAQSIALLGLSPAWFIYQLAASPIVMFARHPNILTYPAAAARMVKRYRSTDKATREVFNGMYGAGQSNIFDNLRGTPGISSNKKIVSQMADAQALARSTWAGRIAYGIGGNLKRGGPLIAMNRKYEAVLREFDAMLEVDKMIRQESHPKMHRFGRSVSQLDEYTGELIAKLKGKSQAEVEEFFTRNGVARRELGRRVDDAMGNWTALTSNERRAATALIFYPFLRFSLRWLTYSFPKNNPMKMAVLANLAQINTIELEQMNGDEDMSFFSDYGKVHVPGENEVLNLGRIAPASNAYVEAGMGERGALQAAFAGTQPILGTLISAAANQDPFTGEPLEGEDRIDSPGDFLSTVGKEVASLPTVTRPLVDPSSPYSELLRAVRGAPRDQLKSTLIPDASIPADREMEAQRLGRVMGQAFDPITDSSGRELQKADISYMPASPEKLKLMRAYNDKIMAQRELAAQFEKYGIDPPFEDMGGSALFDWPIGGQNKTTQEIPTRDIYLDPKKKKRYYDSGRQYGGSSGPDPLGLGSLSDSDPLGLDNSTDDPLGLGL